MASSATPDAERTPPESSGGSSARFSFRRREPDWSSGREPGELDEAQAVEVEAVGVEVVRRSGASSRDVVPLAPEATADDAPADEAPVESPVVVGRGRWSTPARPVVPVPAAAADEHTAELATQARRELEDAKKEMAEAARAAHAAREEAERAAAAHAERAALAQAAAADAVVGRVAAEQAAQEHVVEARTEAQRREVAEQLASETAERAAAAQAARVEAEEAALRATLEREAAEARARELAASLEEVRAALLEQTRASLPGQQAPVPQPAPAPVPAPAPAPPPAVATRAPAPVPEQKTQPEGVPDVVELRSPASSAVVTVLLGLAALVAAAAAVYEAYLDRLTTPPGLAASAVTVFLVVVVGRAKASPGQVWIEHGILHVDEGDSHRRFDLTTPTTKVEMVGRPGARRWKVLVLRKGMASYEIDARLVDPQQFVAAVRPWRPHLGGGGS